MLKAAQLNGPLAVEMLIHSMLIIFLHFTGRDGYPVLYSGTRDCAKRMFQAEGLASFWRGSFSSLLKVWLSFKSFTCS